MKEDSIKVFSQIPTGVLAGAIVGGIVGLIVLICVGAFVYRKWKARKWEAEREEKNEVYEMEMKKK